MIPFDSLTTFIIASTLLSLAPGPDNIFVLMQSALYGKKSGLVVTLGLCTGLIFHTCAVAIGLAALFQTSTLAFNLLKIIGAAYLLYLAWQAFLASTMNLESDKPLIKSFKKLYLRGVIMNLTNPKVTIFFLAFLPQFASPDVGEIAPQILILGIVFICVALLIFGAIALFAGTIGEWFSHSPKAQIYLNRIAATVFTGLAIKLATTSINSL